MVVYTLELLQHYLENHGNVADCVQNCLRILEEKHCQFCIFVTLWKKWKKLASSSINQSVKTQTQCVHPRILLLWQKVCENCHQQQFTVVLNNSTFRKFRKLDRSFRLLHGQPSQPSSIYQSVKSQTQCIHPRILLLW